jgi:hypothetical protein
MNAAKSPRHVGSPIKENDGLYSDEETARRRDAALLRALNMPPKPHSAMKLGKRKAKAGAKETNKPGW